jgi:uncharacterized caspase-like protein/tetratricopeptide (TPR) repeat protein
MNYITRILFTIILFTLTLIAFAQTRERGLAIKVGATREDLAAKRDVNLWAVVIGISRYKFGDQNVDGNQISNLKNAADDATEIYKFLRSPEGGSFPESNISLLVDEQATKANIEAAFNKLKQSKPDDYFVVFIAAHGVIWQEKGASGRTEEFPYFVLYDTDPRTISQSGMRMESFKRTVNSLPAKKGLVISDTCHSAGVMLDSGSRGLAVTQRANNEWLDALKEIPRGVGYLSAADQNESSLEKDELGHGVFTYCLLEAVRGNADFDADGKVTFEELRTYVRDEVPKMTNNRQHPQYATSMLSANQLPLSVVTYPEIGKCSEAPCGTLRITNPEVDGVTILVDDKSIGTLPSGSQRTIRVPVGVRSLTLAKGGKKQTQSAEVKPNQTTSYEINAAFTQSDQESVVETTSQVQTINLGEEKPPTKEAEKKLQEGVDLFNKQKYRDAIAVFNEAVRINGGGYHQAFTYRGRAEQSLGLKEDAIKSFSEALAVRPTDYQTRTLLAEAKFNAGRNTEEIVSELRAINKRYPLYDFAYVVLGDVLFSRGDKIAAEQALRKAIGINPKFPPARMILAHVLMSKDPAAKFVDMGKAVDAVPLKDAKFMSISHVIFGGARYADDAALAESNYLLGKAYTRYAGWEESRLPDSVRMSYVDKGRVNINQALQLAQNLPDKMRLFLSLWISADNAFLKGDNSRALKDAEAALKLADAMPHAELAGDKFELYTILYQANYVNQEYSKAAEALRKGLAIYGARLPADERQRITDMLRECEERGKANRKKK